MLVDVLDLQSNGRAVLFNKCDARNWFVPLVEKGGLPSQQFTISG